DDCDGCEICERERSPYLYCGKCHVTFPADEIHECYEVPACELCGDEAVCCRRCGYFDDCDGCEVCGGGDDYPLRNSEFEVNLPNKGITNEQLREMTENGELSNTYLTRLNLLQNLISDITPLEDFTNLERLNLGNNEIVDISPLSQMVNLKQLHLGDNKIGNVSVLFPLKNLEVLDLRNNPIGMAKIKALQAELPWCVILYTPTLGQIVSPGNGEVTIFDALEILKYLVGINGVIDNCDDALAAALITENSQTSGEPGIFDVLEILKYLVGMPNVIG
ncbi:MAG: leucine-rich repeat domain-containing protein, partial [Oscillospiraceae bacterium]|nr:leucine-rich repeat domain-containing protein [Oscillospiraceae bacterium]